jgi:hypothetical protein
MNSITSRLDAPQLKFSKHVTYTSEPLLSVLENDFGLRHPFGRWTIWSTHFTSDFTKQRGTARLLCDSMKICKRVLAVGQLRSSATDVCVKCSGLGILIGEDKISFTRLEWIIAGCALARDINAPGSDSEKSFFDSELRRGDIAVNQSS